MRIDIQAWTPTRLPVEAGRVADVQLPSNAPGWVWLSQSPNVQPYEGTEVQPGGIYTTPGKVSSAGLWAVSDNFVTIFVESFEVSD